MHHTRSALRLQEGDDALEGLLAGSRHASSRGRVSGGSGGQDYPLGASVFGDRNKRGRSPLPAATPRMTDTGPVL